MKICEKSRAELHKLMSKQQSKLTRTWYNAHKICQKFLSGKYSKYGDKYVGQKCLGQKKCEQAGQMFACRGQINWMNLNRSATQSKGKAQTSNKPKKNAASDIRKKNTSIYIYICQNICGKSRHKLQNASKAKCSQAKREQIVLQPGMACQE